MNSVIAHPSNAAARIPAARLRLWLTWMGAAVLVAPATVVLHEFGHFLIAHAFAFPDVALHYGSVTDGAAEAGFPLWQQGIQAAAGPLVTLGIVLACCYTATRLGSRPWIVAAAFAAGVRSVLIGAAYLAVRLRHPDANGNFDELNAALALGFSTELVIAANVLLLLAAWVFLTRRIPPGQRVLTLATAAAGTTAGLVLYMGWLGPWILP